jgi:hypothetical protein
MRAKADGGGFLVKQKVNPEDVRMAFLAEVTRGKKKTNWVATTPFYFDTLATTGAPPPLPPSRPLHTQFMFDVCPKMMRWGFPSLCNCATISSLSLFFFILK